MVKILILSFIHSQLQFFFEKIVRFIGVKTAEMNRPDKETMLGILKKIEVKKNYFTFTIHLTLIK